MLLQTGQRTDIPAFYSQWFMNRIRQGYVLVRNPYYPKTVLKYKIDPEHVEILGFCTKNPHPMLPYLDELSLYHQFWFVTITSYGKDIEPNVPNKKQILEDFKILSKKLGKQCIVWRFDPIFISERYSISYQLHAFETIAKELCGYTQTVVISFIDLYDKVKRNFPEVREVNKEDRLFLGKEMIRIAHKYGMEVKTCAEGRELEVFGANCDGCTTKETLEKALHLTLDVPVSKTNGRKECSCLIAGDIGEYNTCMHFCRYCYANYSRERVLENYKKHDPDSPLLIGHVQKEDVIKEAQQPSWIRKHVQISLFEEL
ncbi:MAG: DUF1848 domain-containing protein [Bacillota bacterium]|nr:DUF1848 domain-containing protein [Bacillota bacterium]